MGCYKMYIMICSSTCYKRVLHAAEVFCSTEQPFINLQDYFNLTRVTHTERSQVAYLEVMDAISDRKDTSFFLESEKQHSCGISSSMHNL